MTTEPEATDFTLDARALEAAAKAEWERMGCRDETGSATELTWEECIAMPKNWDVRDDFRVGAEAGITAYLAALRDDPEVVERACNAAHMAVIGLPMSAGPHATDRCRACIAARAAIAATMGEV